MVLVPKTILFKRPKLPEATVLDILTDADEANQFVKEYFMTNGRDKFDQFLFDRGRLYGFVVHSEVASPAEMEHLSKLEARRKKEREEEEDEDEKERRWSVSDLGGGSSNRKTKGKSYKNANVGKSQSSRKDRATRGKRK
jgi:hypothetical protein